MRRAGDGGRAPGADTPGRTRVGAGRESAAALAGKRRRAESAQELLTLLGAHLRAARKERGLTLAQVACAAGLTKGFLSQLERGESSASIASLLALCSVLDISIAKLLEDAADGGLPSPVVRRAERRPMYLGGEGIVDELISPPHERRFEVFETHIDPQGSPSEQPYAVEADFGFAYVLHGRLEFTTRGAVYLLQRGDSITYAPGDPHTFRNPSNSRRATVIFMKSPAVF